MQIKITLKISILFTLTLLLAIFLSLVDPQLLIVPCIILTWIFSSSQKYSDTSSNTIYVNKKKIFLLLLIVGIIAGELTEIFAILSNLNLPPEQRILFLPDPLLDLIVSFAYYFPLSVVLAGFLVKFDLDWKWVFLAGGIYGILTEQTGAIFLSFNLIFWLYVALVYGSFIAIPAVALRFRLNLLDRKSVNPIVLTFLLVFILIFTYLFLARILMAMFFIALNIPF